MSRPSGYESPRIDELGSVLELTQININKKGDTGDTVTINGQIITVPGSAVIG